jgi:hypothetical protein
MSEIRYDTRGRRLMLFTGVAEVEIIHSRPMILS